MSDKPRASAATEGSRKPVRRSGTPFDRRRTFGGTNPFQTSADILRINVDALVTIYKETIDVTKKMMQGGQANVHLGYFGTTIYADLLHGGAYLCPIDERPYYKGEIRTDGKFYPGGTKYDPQNIGNLPSKGIGDYVAKFLAGSGASPAALYDEVLINANCPHVFPKILSDEAYGLIKLGLAYSATVDGFKTASTGVATLVQAESNLIRSTGEFVSDVGGAIPKGVAGLQALLPLLAGA